MKQTTKKSMRIMIVEPEASSTEASSRLTKIIADPRHYNNLESPYAVESILSPAGLESSFELFTRKHPDVILIDLDYSGNDAFEFCRRIRAQERDRHTGLIFFSKESPAVDGILEKVLEHGGDDFIDEKASDREVVARINAVFRFKAMTDRLRSANHHLKVLSLTDELTGLSNMRAFNLEYQKLIKACRRGETGLGTIMVDLDHFKRINDTANHLVGSFVIGEVGRLIAHSGVISKGSIAARYGGDEFIICVPTNSVAELWGMAETMRDLILRSVFKKEQFTTKLTGSFGVAWVDPGFEGKSDDLIKAADVMLYRSKRAGRNMTSGMILRYPVDFEHVGRPHLIDETCRDGNPKSTRIQNA